MGGGNWSKGYVFQEGYTPDRGMFPLNFCWQLDPAAYLKSGVASVATKFGKVEKFAQVVHAMKAQLDEEIDLVEGQIIRITEVIDKDWWRGEVSALPSKF